MKTELVTNLKRQATRILSDLHVLEGIVRGERAVLEGRTYSEEEAKRKLNKWLD